MSTDSRRPISPHLQVYRPQLTAVLSSLHRLSGLALVLAAVGLACWVVTIALGQGAYATYQQFLASRMGQGLLAFGVVAFFYHLGNGVRHLAWDGGYGFDLRNVYRSGWLVIAFVVIACLSVLVVWV
jgi:succinate dehydrogenase / fumarate reductase cytochrome b subunit